MNIGNELPRFSNAEPTRVAIPNQTAVPASAPAGCACGAPGGVCTCADNRRESGFVYVIGTVEAEYPNVAIEREMQILAEALLPATWRSTTQQPTKLTEDRSWQHAVLSADRDVTRYIARQLSWRLTVEDLPAFVLRPQDPRDFDVLVDCLSRPKYPATGAVQGRARAGRRPRRAVSTPISPPVGPSQDLDVIVGVKGSATPDGIEVLVDQIFTISPNQLAPAGLHVFAQLSDNYGLTDEDRAYNFLAARYTIPAQHLNQIRSQGLVGIPIISSRLSGAGHVVRVIFTLRGTNTPIERKYFVRVDVTHEFPIMISPWQEYLERGELS